MAGEGRQLGGLSGRITFNTSAFGAARQQITQQSKLIVDGINQIGTKTKATGKQVSDSFQGIGQSAQKAAGTTTAAFDGVVKAIDRVQKKNKEAGQAPTWLTEMGKEAGKTASNVDKLTAAFERQKVGLKGLTGLKPVGPELQKFLKDVASGAASTGEKSTAAVSGVDKLTAALARQQEKLKQMPAAGGIVKPTFGRNLLEGGITGAAPDMSGLRQDMVRSSLTGFDAIKTKASETASAIKSTLGAAAAGISQGFKTAGAGIAAGIDRARASIKSFNESPLGKIQKGLEDVKNKIMGVSLAAGALTAFGIKTSQSIKNTETAIRLFTGSAKEAQKVLDKTRELSDKFHIPYTDLLQSARSFLPLAKQTNTEFGTLAKLAIKIQAYAPRKSLDDIRFGLTEALSGDFVSLKDSMDLSRSQRDELKKALEENGPTALIEGLGNILKERGIDDKFLEELGASGAHAFEELGSSFKEMLDSGFRPFLAETLIPLVNKFKEFFDDLRKNHPDILKTGATLTLIVAAAYPLMTVLTSLIGLWKGIAAAAALAGLAQKKAGEDGAAAGGMMSGKLGTVAKGGVAIAAGVTLGNWGAQQLANDPNFKPNRKNIAGVDVSTDDLQRIRAKELGGGGENVGDVLGERIKQIIVIFVDQIFHLAHTIAKIDLFIMNAIDQYLNVFKLGGVGLGQAFEDLRKMFGNLMIGLADAMSGLFDTTGIREAGKAAVTIADEQHENQRKEAERLTKRLAEGFAVPQSELDRIETNINNMRGTVVGGLADALGLIPKKVDAVAAEIEEAANNINIAPLGDSDEFLKDQAAEITESVKQYNEDILSLENERLLALSEANQQFADDQVKIAQEVVKASKDALEKLIQDREKMNTEFVRDEEKDERERLRKIRDKQIEFQRKEVEDNEAHAVDMAETRRKQMKDEQLALLDFDFRKLFEMSLDNAGSLSKDNTEFAAQREARNKALEFEAADMEQAFKDERDERLIKFNQDLSDRSLAYQQETAQLAQQAVEKQIALQNAHNTELQQINSKHAAELQLRQQAMQQELQLLVMSEQQRNAFLLAEQNKYMNQAVQMAGQWGIKMSQALQMRGTVQGAAGTLQNVGQRIGSTVSGIAGNIGGAISNVLNGAVNAGSTTAPASGATLAMGTSRAQPTTRSEPGGFSLASRPFGGPLAAGQTSLVNDQFRGQMEWYKTGTQAYALPGGAGILQPLKPGRIDPGTGSKGGDKNITVPITIYGSVDESLIPMIEAATRRAVAEALEMFD